MRVLFISGEYPPLVPGGIGANLSGIVPALSRLGHDVHVLNCVAGATAHDRSDGGAQIHTRALLRLRLIDRLLPPVAAARVRAAMTVAVEYRRLRLRPDVVNMPDWMGEGALLTLIPRLPTVVYLHTPLLLTARHNGVSIGRRGRVAHIIERAAVRRATAVTSTSRKIADDLAAEGWIGPTQPITVIPPPVEFGLFDDLPAPSTSEPIVLCVGRIEPRKNPLALIEAAALLATRVPDLKIVFIGKSAPDNHGRPHADELRAAAQRLGVQIEVIDHIPRTGVIEWYGRARVVAVPSRYESFSMVALEAMAACRPVVVTDTTGAAEIVVELGHQHVTPDGDWSALAQAIEPFLVDRDLADSTGQRARQIAEQHCTPTLAASRRAEVFAAAINATADTKKRKRSS